MTIKEMEGKYLTATDYNKFMNAKIKKKMVGVSNLLDKQNFQH